jgi:hypothetical protein
MNWQYTEILYGHGRRDGMSLEILDWSESRWKVCSDGGESPSVNGIKEIPSHLSDWGLSNTTLYKERGVFSIAAHQGISI